MDAVSLACCLLAFLLYYTTLDAGFVYDDRRAILTNPDILPTSSWSNLLKNDFWGTPLTDSGSHGSYRPLCVFTFRINYILGGFQPWGYHLVNVLLHVLATGLVVRVARTILPSGCGHFGPAVAGLLFASHPIHTEAVAGIVGRADLAACNLYLLAFLVYVVHVKYRDTVCPKANYYCVCCDTKNARYVDKKTQKTSTIASSTECSDKMSSRCRNFFANLRKNCYITQNDFCCMKHNMILSALSVVGDTNGSASTPVTASNRVRGICGSVDMSSRVIACSCATISNTSSGIVSSNIACWTRVFKQWLALVSCLVLATAAVLSKETGISVLVLCGIYDVIHSPLKISNKKQVRSICVLFVALLALLTLRLQMASGNTPTFSTADNPTAREPSIITRFLTFTYLPTFNFRLLLCPVTLSFDWSMEAIPRITSIFDSRNLVSLVFYYILFKTIKFSVNKLRRARNHSKKDTNVYMRRAQNSRLCRRRLQQYGFTDGMTLTSTTTTTTTTATTTLTSLILEQRAHIVGHGMIPTSSSTPCPCPVCHHSVSEHHSPKCRTTNNNNSLPISHSACVCRPASILNTSTYGGTNSIPSQSTYSYSTKDKTKSGAPAAILLAVAFLTLPFLPATNLFFYVGFVVAERVLYLPSVGYCLLFALGAARVWCAYRRHHRVIAACLVLVLVAFSVRTVRRNRDWKDEESLYRSAIHVNPAKAYGNLGSILSSQGRITEAEWAYNRALEHRSNMADVHYNLGLLLQGREQYDEAIRSYQRAIHFRPSLALAYVNLGGALVAAGRCQEAVSVLRQGAQLDGAGLKDRRAHDAARVSALLQLGALYADQGRLQRALAAYREALHTMPHHYPPQSVYNLLGETLTRLQQFEEAERWYQAALQAQPDHVPAHITYGKLLAKNSSRVAEAEQWFRRAQRLAPEDPSVHHHFGEFLASQQRHAEAALHYVRAAELKPDDYELVVAAATALRQADRRHDAEQWYRQAVQLRPTDARGHTNLGAILHLNGKYSQAAASYREALRLQPDDITTLTNLHKLYSLMA